MKKKLGFWGKLCTFSLLTLAAVPSAFAAEEPLETESVGRSEYKGARYEPSPMNFGLDLFYVPGHFPNYRAVDGTGVGNPGPGFRVAAEWIPFAGFLGKTGIGLGIDYLKVPLAAGGRTVSSLPLEAFVSYRLDFVDNQFIVPFAKVGVERAFTRDSGATGQGRYDGWTWTAGLSILLDKIDPRSAISLDNSTGINNTYLTLEYVKSQPYGTTSSVNLARDEIRAGLRFEI